MNLFSTIDENITVLLICLLFYPALLILSLVSKLIKLIYKNIQNKYLKNVPVIENNHIKIYAFIFSYYFTDKMPLVCGHGMIGDLHYNIYKASGGIEIYRIGLDFDTKAHIVGISKKCIVDKIALENYLLINNMEIVTLEGDFSNQIEIYANKNQGELTQYVIDPEVMVCIENDLHEDFWEISDNDLYVAHNLNYSKTQNYIKEITKFINEIRPAFYKSTKREWSDAGETPYGEYEDKTYLCPICNKEMIKNKYWYECPDYDGIMINGKYVVKINNNEIKTPNEIQIPKPHGVLKCPNCNNELQPTGYQNGKITIDSCSHCPIRWLDSGEINKIAPADKLKIKL